MGSIIIIHKDVYVVCTFCFCCIQWLMTDFVLLFGI